VAVRPTPRSEAPPFLSLLAHQLPPALEEINVPSYVIDSSGRIRWLNQAAKDLVGDVTGRLYTSLIELEDLPRARSRFTSNLRGDAHGDFAVDLVGLDGEKHRVEISSVPLRSRHRAIGMFGLVRPWQEGNPRAPRIDGRLTHRQHEILEELASGQSTDQIAVKYHLSRETVRNHIRHILQRLGAKSRLEAVAIARRDQILV
jgi:DNA-binding CsgD family transcriptional regulator